MNYLSIGKVIGIVYLSYLFFTVSWVFYLAVMNLKRNHAKFDNISRHVKYAAYHALIIGYPLDVSINLIVGTAAFRERPKEWLFSNRLERMKKATGWRRKRATYFCDNWLNPFDPTGKHC